MLKSKKNLKPAEIENHPYAKILEIFNEQLAKYVYLRLFPGLETKCRELNKAADITTCEEPLEKTPYEAEPEILQKPTNLHPVV
jgi:hypothetical protein